MQQENLAQNPELWLKQGLWGPLSIEPRWSKQYKGLGGNAEHEVVLLDCARVWVNVTVMAIKDGSQFYEWKVLQILMIN